MNNFTKILFVVDSTSNDTNAANLAAKLAHDNQATLSVVTVFDAPRSHSSDAASAVYKQALGNELEELESFVKKITPTGRTIESKVLIGRAFVEIIREVLRSGYDLVIKSVEQPGSNKNLGYSAADMKLLRKCPCPVWLAKSDQHTAPREILVALDYEPDNSENNALNTQLLETSAAIAIAEFSELHIVHAWSLEQESFLRSPRTGLTMAEVDAMVRQEEIERRNWLTSTVNACLARFGKNVSAHLKPHIHVLKGKARIVIPKCAKDIGVELVILGTVARTGIPGLIMGNTAEAILSQIECSVLTVKPAGFISPIMLN